MTLFIHRGDAAAGSRSSVKFPATLVRAASFAGELTSYELSCSQENLLDALPLPIPASGALFISHSLAFLDRLLPRARGRETPPAGRQLPDRSGTVARDPQKHRARCGQVHCAR